MAFVRGIAATTLLAGLAVAAAGAASADAPTMNGSYTESSTSPGGRTVTSDWSVNPCASGAEGCIWVKAGSGGGQAYLVDGQWVMDTMNSLTCPDGSFVQYATSAHMVWDPNTLQGTSQITYIIPACGKPAGYQQTNQIQLKQSS